MKLWLSAVVVLGAFGCSSSSNTGNTQPKTDGGLGGDGAVVGDGGSGCVGDCVTFSGALEVLQVGDPVKEASVTIGNQTAQSDAEGKFSVQVPKDTVVSMTVSKTGYLKVVEQKFSIKTNVDRGAFTMVTTATADNLFRPTLPGSDTTKATGIVSLFVLPTGSCSVEGATVDFAPKGNAKIIYMGAALPDKTLTAVKAASFPSAILYNLDVSTPITVTVTPPPGSTCTQGAFPFEYTIPSPGSGVTTFTGDVPLESGDALSAMRVFLK